jgi:hypothetical protein
MVPEFIWQPAHIPFKLSLKIRFTVRERSKRRQQHLQQMRRV